MQFFIAFSTLLAVATAANIGYYAAASGHNHAYSSHSSSLVTPTQQQYHTQDGFGQYAYGYSEPHSAKQESRSLDGITRGAYSYRDAEGKLQSVHYTADADGFHVAATNLPRAAVAAAAPIAVAAAPLQPFLAPAAATAVDSDTIAVTAARAAGDAALQKTQLRLAKSESGPISVDAAHNFVELRFPSANTVGVVQPARAAVAFEPAAYPRVFGYSYPLNSRFLASQYFY